MGWRCARACWSSSHKSMSATIRRSQLLSWSNPHWRYLFSFTHYWPTTTGSIGGRGAPLHSDARFKLEALEYVKSTSENDKVTSCRPATLSFNTLGMASSETCLEALKCSMIVRCIHLMLTYRETIIADEYTYFARRMNYTGFGLAGWRAR